MNQLISVLEAAEQGKTKRNSKCLRFPLSRGWEHQVCAQTLESRMLQATPLSLWQRSPDGTVKHSKIRLIKSYFIFLDEQRFSLKENAIVSLLGHSRQVSNNKLKFFLFTLICLTRINNRERVIS